MENYAVTVNRGEEVHHFEVGEYLHSGGDRCKYRVYENGVYVASFQPDGRNYLHICQNPAGLEEELLYQVADQIESRMPHSWSKLLNEDPSEG